MIHLPCLVIVIIIVYLLIKYRNNLDSTPINCRTCEALTMPRDRRNINSNDENIDLPYNNEFDNIEKSKYIAHINELNYKLNQLKNKLAENNLVIYNELNNNFDTDKINSRDVRVVNDKLYPILNRVEKPIINSIIDNQINSLRRHSPDTFRPMALVKERNTHDVYYLMGRQKYRGSNRGEFYLVSPNFNKGTKIPLNDEPNDRPIKDYYALPTDFKINNGIFTGMTFDVQELKNGDLTSDYY